MLESESGILYTGIYRATVIKQETHGRLKLYIYGVTPKSITDYYSEDGIYNDILVSDLPFAEPAMSLFGGTGTTNGFISYPHIGATVWCFFENYDYMRPVYFATCPAGEIYNSEYLDELSSIDTEYSINEIKHDLVIGNNRLTFNEKGHVILKVQSHQDISAYTVIDILPNTTDILITNGNVYTHISAIPDKSDIAIINSETSSHVIVVPGEVYLTTDIVNAYASKSTTITSPKIELNSSTTTINGITTINGDTTINGTTTITPDAIIGGKSFIGHTHTGNVGAPTSPPL